MNKKILVTGSEGYIGSILVPLLIEKQYEVLGIDSCFYSEGNFTQEKRPLYKLIRKDIRDIEIEDLTNIHSIIHLAALSNDPLGMLDQDLTLEINYRTSVRLAELAKQAGVKRFIFSSSCSLYGQGQGLLTEESIPNPQTVYGKSKILAEQEISKLADENFSPIFMRNSTAYGISPRMRFDLVVNSLAGFAQTTNKIQILGDGTPWRPLVHIKDISGACIAALEAEKNIIHNEAFNVGDNEENYQVKTIAQQVQKQYPNCEIHIAQKNVGDTRDYQVSFNKLNTKLGFKISMNLEKGIKEIANAYRDFLDEETFDHRFYTRLKQIHYLLDQNILTNKLKYKV